MAKLNGVFVSEEATKIIVGGVEYAESEDKVAPGDIVRMDETCSDSDRVTNGSYYVVDSVDSCDDAQITDDNGREFDTVGDVLTVFKRVKAAAEPASVKLILPGQYVIHDGALYVKESRKATVGEYVLITKKKSHFIRVGEVVKCVGFGDFAVTAAQFSDDRGHDGTQFITNYEQYEVLTPASSVKIGNVSYNVEKRKPVAGEHVLTLNGGYDARFQSADIYEVIESDGEEVFVKHPEGRNFRHGGANFDGPDYVVLVTKASATAPKYREVKRRARVGERIKIVDVQDGRSRYGNGAEFDVIESEDAFVIVKTAKHPRICVLSSEYVVLEPVEAAPPARLAVGDYAKVTEDIYEYKTGDIVHLESVVSRKGSVFDFSIVNVRTGRTGYVANSFIVRVTDEEVVAAKAEAERKKAEEADAKAKRAEETKWAAIGRKVGEIKAGDVVRVTNGCGGHVYGTIGICAGVSHGSAPNCHYYVTANGRKYSGEAELIAPVESLFARQ